LGPRGDAIIQFDDAVGHITSLLDSLEITEETLIILTSDNGPVVDDGYKDLAEELLGNHTPAGILRGGKYSAFEGGTMVPFIVRWNRTINPGISDAGISQVDLPASLASFTRQEYPDDTDGMDLMELILGKSRVGRDFIIEQNVSGTLSVLNGKWKYIPPGEGPRYFYHTKTETGNDTIPQLYDLERDPGEKNNVHDLYPEVAGRLRFVLDSIVHVN
jgi:arylsulfatase A-like enzyme